MRNTPTEIILLQIAEGLQSIIKNPDLSQTIKDANALLESEKLKAEDARQLIAQADAIREELKKREDALSIVNDQICQAEKLENFNSDTLREIAKKNADLDKKANQNLDDFKSNQIEKQELSDLRASLDERALFLKNSENEITDMKNDLIKRANNMKAEIANL